MRHLWPPVVCICGYKDAGKTTLIEALIPRLRERDLEVGVLKHDAHGLEVDTPGKDTDRYFRAGADVVAHDDAQLFARRRLDGRISLARLAWHLGGRYDLVLVEGHKESPIPKLWVTGEGDDPPPDGVGHLVGTVRRGDAMVDEALDLILKAVDDFCRHATILAGVLIGGASTRMGRPKALLRYKQHSLVEHVVDVVRPWVDDVVLLGAGACPDAFVDTPKIADAPNVSGPMSGILGALRWSPRVRWLILPCDLPLITNEAVEWLLQQPVHGRPVTMPHVPGRPMPDPLFAVYDPPARRWLEDAAETEQFSLRHAFPDEVLSVCPVPPEHASAWRNVNTSEDWQALKDGAD